MMERKSKVKLWTNYGLAYLAWIVSFTLWLWFMLISREAISALMVTYYLNGNFQRFKMYQFVNQGYFYVMGIIWLVLMIFTENYFRQGARKNNLIRRIGMIIGPELLLIFAADAARATVNQPELLGWVALGVELVLGIGLLWMSRKMKPASPPGVLDKANS